MCAPKKNIFLKKDVGVDIDIKSERSCALVVERGNYPTDEDVPRILLRSVVDDIFPLKLWIRGRGSCFAIFTIINKYRRIVGESKLGCFFNDRGGVGQDGQGGRRGDPR